MCPTSVAKCYTNHIKGLIHITLCPQESLSSCAWLTTPQLFHRLMSAFSITMINALAGFGKVNIIVGFKEMFQYSHFSAEQKKEIRGISTDFLVTEKQGLIITVSGLLSHTWPILWSLWVFL